MNQKRVWKHKKYKKQFSESLKKRIWISFVNTIKDIKRVDAKLHRINLSGNYSYTFLKSELGDLADLTNKKGQRNLNYDKKYLRRFKDFRLTAFVNPTKNFMPPCFLNILPTRDISQSSYKTFLENLNDRLPGLKVSNVEYAIDVFCNSSIENELLFFVIGKTLYVSFQKNVSFFGGQVIGYGGKKICFNVGCHIGDQNKYYQRGQDNSKRAIKRRGKKKRERGWKAQDIDRVRFEFTAHRKNLVNYDMGDLHSFLKNPMFWEMNKNKWQFREFKSEKHPCPWERKTFQEKSITLKKQLKNVLQVMITSKSLEPLKSRIDFAIQEFDVGWSGDYIIQNKELIEIPY